MEAKYCIYCKVYYLGDVCAYCSTKPNKEEMFKGDTDLPDFMKDIFGKFSEPNEN